MRGELSSIDNRFVVLSCPWYLTTRSAAVGWVAEAYEWREKGGLQWTAVPVFARRAITAFARGVQARQNREMEKAEANRGK